MPVVSNWSVVPLAAQTAPAATDDPTDQESLEQLQWVLFFFAVGLGSVTLFEAFADWLQ